VGELSAPPPGRGLDAQPSRQGRPRRGGEVLVSIHGQSVQETGPTPRRAILARAELTTEASPYRWLNTCFLVGEGEIDEERENWWLDTYVCVNDQAQARRRSAPSHRRDSDSTADRRQARNRSSSVGGTAAATAGRETAASLSTNRSPTAAGRDRADAAGGTG
jgi:hypothetical protein